MAESECQLSTCKLPGEFRADPRLSRASCSCLSSQQVQNRANSALISPESYFLVLIGRFHQRGSRRQLLIGRIEGIVRIPNIVRYLENNLVDVHLTSLERSL